IVIETSASGAMIPNDARLESRACRSGCCSRFASIRPPIIAASPFGSSSRYRTFMVPWPAAGGPSGLLVDELGRHAPGEVHQHVRRLDVAHDRREVALQLELALHHALD